MKVIEIIKEKRIEKGLNQREVSELLNLPINAWQKIESGQQNLRLDDFLKIIKILDLPITIFSDQKLLVISEKDFEDLNKATELLNTVTKRINQQEIKITDNHGTITINNEKK